MIIVIVLTVLFLVSIIWMLFSHMEDQDNRIAKLNTEVYELSTDVSKLTTGNRKTKDRLDTLTKKLDNHMTGKEYVVLSNDGDNWITRFTDDGEPVFTSVVDSWTGCLSEPKLFTQEVADGLATIHSGEVYTYQFIKEEAFNVRK